MDELDGHPMCGVLGGIARFTPRLTLGYRDAVAIADSPLFTTGQRVGTTNSTAPQSNSAATGNRRGSFTVATAPRSATVRCAGVHASYLHTHPAAHPHSVARFVRCAGRH